MLYYARMWCANFVTHHDRAPKARGCEDPDIETSPELLADIDHPKHQSSALLNAMAAIATASSAQAILAVWPATLRVSISPIPNASEVIMLNRRNYYICAHLGITS